MLAPPTSTRPPVVEAKREDLFLPRLWDQVKNKDNWLVQPDTTNHPMADCSILKARVVPSSGRELNAMAVQQLRRVCPRSCDVSNLQRQLQYYFFRALKGDSLLQFAVEIKPGKVVQVQYKRYTHCDLRDGGMSKWSNKGATLHEDLKRSTNNGRGTANAWRRKASQVGTKRSIGQRAGAGASGKRSRVVAVAPPPPTPVAAVAEDFDDVLPTLEELLVGDDALMLDLMQHECNDYDPKQDCSAQQDQDDILQCLSMNMNWSDSDADLAIAYGNARI
tara:strand:- start:333 stop:1163 length:831 start_codon:yes stop_codon:yes gene_type:complete